MGKIANSIGNRFTSIADITEMRKEKADPINNAYINTEFRSFVFAKKANRRYILIASTSTLIQFIVFKLLYPFPDFISDSYSYISTNLHQMDVNLWPIGYSKFIALIHLISPSDTFLIGIQFLIMQIASIYFFFSLSYLYKLESRIRSVIFIFLFFNPIFIYLSNCVLSDALFYALSMVWFTQMLWMLNNPVAYRLIVLTILIGMLFTIRYTAIYYPFVMAFAALFSGYKPILKFIAIIAPWLFIAPFILYTQAKTQEVTGTKQFSVFGGWQLANNALYMYDHIEVNPDELPLEARQFDHMVKQYFTAVPPEFRELSHFPGTFFIKHSDAPLKQYMFKYVKDKSWGFRSWGKVSPMYSSYGTYLISRHPIAFAQYYLLLNSRNYFVPHLEKFGSYNIGMDSVWQEAKIWFQYSSSKVKVISKTFQGDLFFIYPTLFLLLNVSYIYSFIRLLKIKKADRSRKLIYTSAFLVTLFLVFNFLFSVWATPVVLRYQLIPMILLLSFSAIFIEIINKMKKESIKGTSQLIN